MLPNIIPQENQYRMVLGHTPLGQPGWGPAFGALPSTLYMPPMPYPAREGTFFQPQALNPYYPQFGGGVLGGIAGYGMQAFGQLLGYTYLPPNVSPFDVTRARHMERQMRQTMNVGRMFDEMRLAQLIKSVAGEQSNAYANALASILSGSLRAANLQRYFPGGSAEQFAGGMFLAGQMMRDYTADRYGVGGFTQAPFRLGLPNRELQSLVARMQDFFAPGGVPDPQRMGRMTFGDLGGLAQGLTSWGLLRAPAVDYDDRGGLSRDLREYVGQIRGLDWEALTPAERQRTAAGARAYNIGNQLRQYADVVSTMREIMGDPEAPLPQIIENLQAIAGGMQQYTPADLLRTLNRMRDTAAATGIPVGTLSAMMRAGAERFEAAGLHPGLGAEVARLAGRETVASQLWAPGPYRGRLAPDREYALRQASMMRVTTAPGTRISAQALMLLEEMDPLQLDAQQRQIYEEIQRRALALEWDPGNMNALQARLEQLGVGRTRSAAALWSNYGVQEYLQRNPELITVGRGRQISENQRRLAEIMANAYRGLDAGDWLRRNLESLAGPGRSPEQIMQLFGRTLTETRTMADEEILELMAPQVPGLTISDVRMMRGRAGNLPEMQSFLGQRGYRNLEEYGQENRVAALRASEELGKRTQILTAGRNILAAAGLQAPDLTARVVGAAEAAARAGRPASFTDLAMAAFGFVPTEEVFGEAQRLAVEQLQPAMEEYRKAQEQLAKAPLDQRETASRAVEQARERLRQPTEVLAEIAQQYPGVGPAAVPFVKGLEIFRREDISRFYRLAERGRLETAELDEISKMLQEWGTGETADILQETATMADESVAGHITRAVSANLPGALAETSALLEKVRAGTATPEEAANFYAQAQNIGKQVLRVRTDLEQGYAAALEAGRRFTPEDYAERINAAFAAVRGYAGAPTPAALERARGSFEAMRRTGLIEMTPEGPQLNVHGISGIVAAHTGLTPAQQSKLQEDLARSGESLMKFYWQLEFALEGDEGLLRAAQAFVEKEGDWGLTLSDIQKRRKLTGPADIQFGPKRQAAGTVLSRIRAITAGVNEEESLRRLKGMRDILFQDGKILGIPPDVLYDLLPLEDYQQLSELRRADTDEKLRYLARRVQKSAAASKAAAGEGDGTSRTVKIIIRDSKGKQIDTLTVTVDVPDAGEEDRAREGIAALDPAAEGGMQI